MKGNNRSLSSPNLRKKNDANYFPVKIRFHDIDYFTLWYSNNDFDALLLNKTEDKILSFGSLELLFAYAKDLKLVIDKQALMTDN